MNYEIFFARLRSRSTGVFGTRLTQGQVDGCNAIVKACEGLEITFTAYLLATAYHETAHSMQPIKETVMPHHRDKNPSDNTVIARLDKAYKAGKLGQVSKPYWRQGYFGRGYVQLTHFRNYVKAGAMVNQPLADKPDLALRPDIAAQVLVQGSLKGIFTGKKLGDYLPGDYKNARRVINGTDRATTIAKHAKAFEAALRAAGYTREVKPQPKPNPLAAFFAAILKFITGLLKGK